MKACGDATPASPPHRLLRLLRLAALPPCCLPAFQPHRLTRLTALPPLHTPLAYDNFCSIMIVLQSSKVKSCNERDKTQWSGFCPGNGNSTDSGTRLRAQGRVRGASPNSQPELQTSEHTVRRHLREAGRSGPLQTRLWWRPADLAVRPKRSGPHALQAVDRKAYVSATTAASIVQPKQIILLDTGSTNVAIAAALPDNADLTVVTNSP